NPSADMLLSEEQVKEEWFDDAFALHFCSVSLGDFPMKSAHRKAIDICRKKGAIISFDLNLRFPLWSDKKALYNTLWEFIPLSDIVKISDEELEFITGEKEIKNALPRLFDLNVKLVIYTCGKDGAYAFTKNAEGFAKGINVKAVDTTGAGDGFIGSFLFGLKSLGMTAESLDSADKATLEKLLDFSNRFCAESVRHNGAIASYRKIDF
ncbi:MAG: PfkB family carbohydrate kinase, partial [Oscillospiraceae bacterium]